MDKDILRFEVKHIIIITDITTTRQFHRTQRLTSEAPRVARFGGGNVSIALS